MDTLHSASNQTTALNQGPDPFAGLPPAFQDSSLIFQGQIRARGQHIGGHKATVQGPLSLLQPLETARAPQPGQLKGSPICSLEPRRLQGRAIRAPSCGVSSRPAGLGHPHSPPRPAGSCRSDRPWLTGGSGSVGLGGRAAAHLPRGRRGTARGGQAPARPMARGVTSSGTSAAGCWPHAAEGRHGQLVDGPSRNGVPSPLLLQEKRV